MAPLLIVSQKGAMKKFTPLKNSSGHATKLGIVKGFCLNVVAG